MSTPLLEPDYPADPSARVRNGSRDPVLWIVGGFVAALVVFNVLWPSVPWIRNLELGFYGPAGISVLGLVAPWVALPRLRSGRERTFWLLWTAVFAMSLSIDLLLSYVWIGGTEGAVLEDLMYATLYLAVLVAFWLSPDRPAPPTPTLRLQALEVAGAAAFVGALSVYFVVIPDVLAPEAYVTWVPSLVLFTVLDLFLLGFAVHLFRSATASRWRLVYGWLVAGMALWSLSDLGEALNIAGFAPFLDVEGPADILWQVAWVPPIIAARMRRGTNAAAGPLRDGTAALDRRGPGARRYSPTLLLAFLLALPVVHFGAEFLGLLPPETLRMRQGTVLCGLLLLLVLAYAYQRLLQGMMSAVDAAGRIAERQRTLLATVVERAPDAVVIADADRAVEYFNDTYRRLAHADPSGLDLVEAMALSPERALPAEASEALDRGEAWEGRISEAEQHGARGEHSVFLAPVPGENGVASHYVGLRRDVSREAMLEAQLRQSQTMEALGRLAGGIAHDFNNILAAISGYAEFMEEELPEDSPWKDDVQGIQIATGRAAELVRKILTFSRKGWDDRRSHSAHAIVREAIDLLRAGLPSTVEVHTVLDPAVGLVWVDAHQIHQVVLNLGTNATHAMEPEGGTLEITLRGEAFAEPVERNPSRLPPGDYVHLSVKDSGHGMDAETLGMAFDPFFTTKAVGEGTGLGLSMVHGIVTGYGGGVVAASVVGQGTTVHVYLPTTDRPPDAEGPRSVQVGSDLRRGRLLLVDDEPEVSRATGRALEARGWHVEAVTTTSAALEWVHSDAGGFDAVVTDLTMPEMTGIELAHEVKTVRPDLPVLLMSGFGDAKAEQLASAQSVDAFLRKPSSVDEVEGVLAKLLRSEDEDPEAG